MTQATGSSFFTQAMALATANTASTALPELIAFMGNRLGQTRANQLLAKVGHLLTLEHQYTLHETYLYGSSRLGVKNQQLNLSTRVASVQNGSLTPIGNAILNTDSVFSGTAAVYGLPKAPAARVFNRTWGLKQYELSNHLGNLQVTISDKKHGVVGANQVDFIAYEPEVKSATDYYAYGMEMPGKGWRSEEYKYGFNGNEKVDKIAGSGNVYDFGARIYDSRLGRFFSIDPLASKYPAHSPYSYCLNNPIIFVDPDGADVKPSKAFLNTAYGKVFQDLRKNNTAFQKAIAKYENNKNFNLSLGVDNAKVKAAGASAITETPVDKSNISKSADIASFYLSSTTVPSNSDYKFTNIGVVLVVGHEAVHQKIALTTKNEDDAHNTYNTERQSLVNILTEYNKDNNLGLSVESITALSYSGQQDSKDFISYINGLAKENGTTYNDEKAKYDKLVSDLIYEKKEKK